MDGFTSTHLPAWLAIAGIAMLGFAYWIRSIRRAINFQKRRNRVFEEARRWNDGLLIADYRDEQGLAALQHQVLDPVPRRIERTESKNNKFEVGVAPSNRLLGFRGAKGSTKNIREFLEDTENPDSRLKVLLDRLAGWAITESVLDAVFENALAAERENREKRRQMFGAPRTGESTSTAPSRLDSQEEIEEQNRIDESGAASATLNAACTKRLLVLLVGDWELSSNVNRLEFKRTIRTHGLTDMARLSFHFSLEREELNAQTKRRFSEDHTVFAGVLAIAESYSGKSEHLNLRPLAIFDYPSVSVARANWFLKQPSRWILALPPGLKHLAWKMFLRREKSLSEFDDSLIERYGPFLGKLPQSVAEAKLASTYRKPR